jgi:hypothetical protein
MPSTTQCTRSASAESSVRMPAIFFTPAWRSLGHLMVAFTPSPWSASATATAASKVSSGARCGGSSGRSTSET